MKLSLVTCAVSMTPAISEREKLRFHTLNRETGNRVRSRYVDAGTGKPVLDDNQVKGYETGEDEYVMLEEEEIESVALESVRTINIDVFVPRDSIGWIWHDRPHYLLPDDEVSEEAFAVIRDAMEASDVAGISRVVLYRRERAVMLEPRDRGIVLWTLRYGDGVRDADDYFSKIPKEKPETAEMRLVKKLIDEQTRPWEPSMVQDPVQDRLKDIIAARGKKQKPAKRRKSEEATPQTQGNVVSIMDALRRSIDADKRTRK